MTLYNVIDNIQKIALKQPNIRTSVEGNIYDYMNATPDIQYGVCLLTQGTHRSDESFNYFNFNMFYADRLVDNMESNRLQIQSIGQQLLVNIVDTFCDRYDVEIENEIQYYPFTQKFADETAGGYITVTFQIPREYLCAEILIENNQ